MILSVLLAASAIAGDPSTAVKRTFAHLIIKDYPSAIQEAEKGIEAYSTQQTLWEAYIKALAKSGDEKRMFKAYNRYASLFPKEAINSKVLEDLCWSIIENGARSHSPLVRIMAMVGAHAANDAKGVELLCRLMKDQNSVIRAGAVQLASSCGDALICDEIYRLFKKDPVWMVRMESMQAIGHLNMKKAKPDLLAVISDDQSCAEEKALAIVSLVNLMDGIERDEVASLAKSPRAGLRDLACRVVGYFGLKPNVDLILPLLDDNRAEVRASALQVLGMLRAKEYQSLVEKKLQDPDLETKVMAAWTLTLFDPEKGQAAFREWINGPSKEARLLAAASLTSCGRYAKPLLAEAFYTTSDPYVKMNLSLGMIGQQIDIEEACHALYEGLTTMKERWMRESKSSFSYLAPSTVEHDGLIPNYPEAVNQMTRLEVLNTLAMMKYPKAQEAIKRFLAEKSWGISGIAASLLLTEGDESALDLVQGLLSDPDPKIHTQAALVLSLWGRGEAAVSILQNAYPAADREMKERILEAIGSVGLNSSIPFLVKRLEEPHQSLRLIAAAALLMCLYH